MKVSRQRQTTQLPVADEAATAKTTIEHAQQRKNHGVTSGRSRHRPEDVCA